MIQKNLNRVQPPRDYAPCKCNVERERRATRRDAGWAFVILACVIISATGIGMILVAYVEGRL